MTFPENGWLPGRCYVRSLEGNKAVAFHHAFRACWALSWRGHIPRKFQHTPVSPTRTSKRKSISLQRRLGCSQPFGMFCGLETQGTLGSQHIFPLNLGASVCPSRSWLKPPRVFCVICRIPSHLVVTNINLGRGESNSIHNPPNATRIIPDHWRVWYAAWFPWKKPWFWVIFPWTNR